MEFYLHDDVKRLESPQARFDLMKRDWSSLRADALSRDASAAKRGEVYAANTYAPALITQFLVDGAATKLQNRWMALTCLSKDFSTDRIKPLAVGNLKFITATDGLVQVNATNYEQGDTTTADCQITPAQYTRAFHVSNTDLQSGMRLAQLLDINLAVLADQIISVVTSVITAGNFPTPALVLPPGNFGWGAMQQAWGLLKKLLTRNAILDGEYLAQIINVPTQFQKSGDGPQEGGRWSAFGWDNIALNTNWTAADPNTRGFFCGPTAIACLGGLPIKPAINPGNTLRSAEFLVPGPDIYVEQYNWFDLGSRAEWCSYDLMFGASLLDSLAGLLVKSA